MYRLSYERFAYYGPLPAEIYTHVRCREASGASLARFDITIADASGAVLVDIENFAVLRLANDQSFGGTQQTTAALDLDHLSPAEAAFRRLLVNGIRPDEGWDAFERALNVELPEHVFVSPMRPEQMTDIVRSTRVANTGARFERPSLETEFSEPESATEKALAQIWGDLLGCRRRRPR